MDCFECTDWSVSMDVTSNVSELADTVCCYVKLGSDHFIISGGGGGWKTFFEQIILFS